MNFRLIPTILCGGAGSRLWLKLIELDPESFRQVPDDSIDYAVMEKSRNVAVVPCTMGWSDIGSWGALGELIAPDDHGNRIEGKVLMQIIEVQVGEYVGEDDIVRFDDQYGRVPTG